MPTQSNTNHTGNPGYANILRQLGDIVKSDGNIPDTVRRKADEHIKSLNNLLQWYDK